MYLEINTLCCLSTNVIRYFISTHCRLRASR